MFKLFKKSATNKVMIAEPITDLKEKTVNEVIEEIHETFYTEVDRLLASAKITNSLETTQQDLIDKCERLKALGFTNTKEVIEAKDEINRLRRLKIENEAKENLIECINYFSLKYPNYKFITEDSVKKICEKYNLVYGGINKYIGSVPDENLKHIEDFKIDEADEAYERIHITTSAFQRSRFQDVGTDYVSFDFFNNKKNECFSEYSDEWKSRKTNTYKCKLEIAAPQKDFNMEGMEVKDSKVSKIEIPDPIVLKPVIYNNQKHYLIVTAWGLEAGDEIVVNANHN